MAALKVSEDLRPLTDLKVEAGDIVGQVERTGRPVVLTRHGRGVAVILSISAFEEMQEHLASAKLQRALDEGEADVRACRLIGHDDIVRKHAGRARAGR